MRQAAQDCSTTNWLESQKPESLSIQSFLSQDGWRWIFCRFLPQSDLLSLSGCLFSSALKTVQWGRTPTGNAKTWDRTSAQATRGTWQSVCDVCVCVCSKQQKNTSNKTLKSPKTIWHHFAFVTRREFPPSSNYNTADLQGNKEQVSPGGSS